MLAIDVLSIVNLLFLLVVAFCLFVGLIVAPEYHDRARRDAEDGGERTEAPSTFRAYDDPE